MEKSKVMKMDTMYAKVLMNNKDCTDFEYRRKKLFKVTDRLYLMDMRIKNGLTTGVLVAYIEGVFLESTRRRYDLNEVNEGIKRFERNAKSAKTAIRTLLGHEDTDLYKICPITPALAEFVRLKGSGVFYDKLKKELDRRTNKTE